jgi:hypothetical protein
MRYIADKYFQIFFILFLVMNGKIFDISVMNEKIFWLNIGIKMDLVVL